MPKHRILFHSNPCFLATGLAENSRTLLKYLWKTGKYDIAHYCSQTSAADPRLQLTPWKSFGCLPTDQKAAQELNSDPLRMRNAQYGSYRIDEVIKEWKPSIYVGSDDIWFAPKGDYMDKQWWKQINSLLHITVDSLPILEQAYEQAEHTAHYYTWARFAMKEMNRLGPKFAHVKQIYGAMDTSKFSPITDEERAALKKRFGISESTVIFLFVGRNQLRKQFIQCLESFAHFKREYPQADAKLHFHTSFSEKGNGWDIPKMAAHYGVKLEDVLCTYVCKTCGQWHINPYRGEDLDCPYCGAKKSMITANIVNSVPDDEMRYVYGVSDACISAFSSGGQEYHNSQSLLCGKPLASTNYSSGADFCEQPFVYTLGFTTYIEQGTNFIKATTSIKDIKNFMTKVWKSSRRELVEWGEKGRAWARQTFSIETIGRQWEEIFDAMPQVDWSTVSLTVEPKNDTFPMPIGGTDDEFVTSLYRNILKSNEPIHGEGHRSWIEGFKQGRKREDVYAYFIGVARQDNAKIGAPTQDASVLVDKTTGRKRALFVIKESLGDCLVCTQLFESFHKEYPEHDLYVATDPKHFEVFAGNPHIYQLLRYQDFMEQEMLCIGAGQEDGLFHVYMHPAIQSQRQLNYLSNSNIAHDLNG